MQDNNKMSSSGKKPYRNIPLFESHTPHVPPTPQITKQPLPVIEPQSTTSALSSFSSSVHQRVKTPATPPLPNSPFFNTFTPPLTTPQQQQQFIHQQHNNNNNSNTNNSVSIQITPSLNNTTSKKSGRMRKWIMCLLCVVVPIVLIGLFVLNREHLLDNFFKIHFDKRLQEKQLQSAAQLSIRHIVHEYFDAPKSDQSLNDHNNQLLTTDDDGRTIVNSHLRPLISEIYVYSNLKSSNVVGRVSQSVKNILQVNHHLGKDEKREVILVLMDRNIQNNNNNNDNISSMKLISMNLVNTLTDRIVRGEVKVLYCDTCPSEVSALALAYRVAKGKFWDITLNDKQLYRHIGASIFHLLGTTFMPQGAFDISLLVKDHFNKHQLLNSYQSWNIFTGTEPFKKQIQDVIPLSYDALVQSVYTLEESQNKHLLTPMLTSMGLQRNLILLHGKNIEEFNKEALTFRGKKDVDTCFVVWYDFHELTTQDKDIIYRQHSILLNADLVISNSASVSMRARMFVDHVFTVDEKASLTAVVSTAITFCDAHLFEHQQVATPTPLTTTTETTPTDAQQMQMEPPKFNANQHVLSSLLIPYSMHIPVKGSPEGQPLHVALQVDHFHSYGDLETSVVNLAKAMHNDVNFKVTLINCGIKGEPYTHLESLGVNVYTLSSEAVHSREERLQEYENYVKVQNIQVVNGHYSVFGVQKLEALNIPFIQTIHNHYLWLLEDKFKDLLTEFRNADRLTNVYIAPTTSIAMFSDLKLQLNPEKMVIIRRGISEQSVELSDKRMKQCSNVAFRKELGIEKDDLVFVMPSIIAPVKGQQYAIEALAKLIKEETTTTTGGGGIVPLHRFKLLFVGDFISNKFENKIKHLVESLPSLKHQVIFTGKRSDVSCLLQMSDILLHTSLLDGFSQSVAQGMYFEHLDAILSNTGGSDELITSLYGHSYNRTLNQLEKSECRRMRENRNVARRFLLVDVPYTSLLSPSLNMQTLPNEPNEHYVTALANSMLTMADCSYTRRKFFSSLPLQNSQVIERQQRVTKLLDSYIYKAYTSLFQWLDTSIRPYLREQFSL